MKIISLVSENIKRLKAVELRPDGKSLVIAGRNAQGKSSVLDSIVYALAGKSEVCERPIRDGESRAEIVVDLDEFTVTRTFTAAGGGTLKVVPKGEKHSAAQPQSILDKLIGTLTFDPLAFTRQKESEQASVLRKLVGLDFSDLEQQQVAMYAERLAVGREADVLKGKTFGLQINAGLPTEEISVSALVADRSKAEAVNKSNQAKREFLSQICSAGKQCEEQIRFTKEEIARIEWELQKAKDALANLHIDHQGISQNYLHTKPNVEALVDTDLKTFDAQLIEASEKNEAIRRNQELKVWCKDRDTKSAQYSDLDARLVQIEEERQERLSKTKFPLPGLSFSSDGFVVYNSVPFSQISSAEQLKVSAAIALALNPKLRVMLIRDGSLLDAESLEVLKQLAEQSDAQLWIEKVGGLGTELPGVIIEDGSISESTI